MFIFHFKTISYSDSFMPWIENLLSPMLWLFTIRKNLVTCMAVMKICQVSNEGKTAVVHTVSQNCENSQFMFSNNIIFLPCISHINVSALPRIVLTARDLGTITTNLRMLDFKVEAFLSQNHHSIQGVAKPKQCEAIKCLTSFPQTEKSGCHGSTILSNW